MGVTRRRTRTRMTTSSWSEDVHDLHLALCTWRRDIMFQFYGGWHMFGYPDGRMSFLHRYIVLCEAYLGFLFGLWATERNRKRNLHPLSIPIL